MDDEKLPDEREYCLENHKHRHRHANDEKRIVGFEVNNLVGKKPPKDDRRQRQYAQDHGTNRDITHDPSFAKYECRDESNTKWLTFV